MKVIIDFNNGNETVFEQVEKVERKETFVWLKLENGDTYSWPWRVIDQTRSVYNS